MKLTVDRLEGEIVVCENENAEMVNINLSDFAETPKDGDIVELNTNNKYEVKLEEIQEKSEGIQNRFLNLFKK